MQELFEAKQGGIYIIDALEGVVENIQTLRRDLKKPKSQQLDSYIVDHDLKNNLIGLNKVIKQLKRNKNLN